MKNFIQAAVCAVVIVTGVSTPQVNMADTLVQLSQSEVPQTGTFFLLSGQTEEGTSPPYPFDPYQGLIPIYQMTGLPGAYLVADSAEDYALYQAVMRGQRLSLYQATWGDGGMTLMSEEEGPPAPPGGGEGGGEWGGVEYSARTFSTNLLWLKIPDGGVDETNVAVVLHNALEGHAYTLLTTESLSAGTWLEEAVTYGEVGDWAGAVLERNGRTNLFIRARLGLPEGGLGIVSQPLDQEVLEQDTVTFSVVAAGSGPLTYQWSFNGTNIAGATASRLTLSAAQWGDAGDYAVTVSDGIGSVTSRTAQLTVWPGTGDPFLMAVWGSRQDYSFKEGMSYLIESPVKLYGETVLKGGAVVKVDWYYGEGGSLVVKGSLTCDTQPYYPAILTSVDDDGPGRAWNTAARRSPTPEHCPSSI